ncbi:MAG: hypothetical protein ACI4Q3_03515, partial [Kiritimatiellia bacterium]
MKPYMLFAVSIAGALVASGGSRSCATATADAAESGGSRSCATATTAGENGRAGARPSRAADAAESGGSRSCATARKESSDMPMLNWMGREKAAKATQDVVMKILREDKSLGYTGGSRSRATEKTADAAESGGSRSCATARKGSSDMPMLNWMGREQAIKATQDVVMKILREDKSLGYAGGSRSCATVTADAAESGGSRS